MERHEIKLERKKFQSRMGLAYLSFFVQFILLILLFFFVPADRIKEIIGIAPYMLFSFTSIIAAAMGFKTIEKSKWSK